ncbi:hypothetical protein DDZ14_04090 [Maritimibacter sp. 55A14]|uniref:DUF2061 domain-containing protein n=1 Tax=Maritimibacter sp. 55A14 TaxID=2174844 RepID=UPI000D60C8C2|nr:DUF2061 domain-containing protein [Maritimibacter sp. 55A14]PWE33848.1 hypothetical protein DDZ14_04090 [Maritimibacter sp. 55A14]
METRLRTVVKAIFWNLLGFALMTSVGLVMTGSVSLGGTMALVNTATGLVCYLVYERLWANIRWGRA